MNRTDALTVIAICAVLTYFYRAFPFLFFSKRKVPAWMDGLKQKLPYAFMVILVVYCLKDCAAASLHTVLCSAGGCAVTVLLHLWKRNTIVSVAGGTVIYMLLLWLL